MTNYSRASDAGPDLLALYDRDEDGFPCYGLPDTLPCGSCGEACASLLPCTWDAALQVGACCAVHEDDAEEAAFLALGAAHGATVSEPSEPRIGETSVVDRWEPPMATVAEGGHWVERELVWDGAAWVYAARKAVQSETTLGAVAGRKTLGA